MEIYNKISLFFKFRCLTTKMRTIAFCSKWQNLLLIENKWYLTLISLHKIFIITQVINCVVSNQHICINKWLMSFQQKVIVLVSFAIATDFEPKSNRTDEFYKRVKFQANSLWAYNGISVYSSIVFGSAAMTSYWTFFMGTRHKVIHFSTLTSSFSSFWEMTTSTKLDIT